MSDNDWTPAEVLEMVKGWDRAYLREGRGIPEPIGRIDPWA